MRILVIDDDITSRLLLKKLLSGYGECVLEDNGKAALGTFLKALGDDAPFDLIFLDIVMPEMDGHEFLQAVRQMEQQWAVPPGREVRVVMTTSLNSPKEATKAFFKGQATAYLVKPVDKKTIDEKLLELFAGSLPGANAE
ncbi:MAG: response regulator [Humidesulfovibrio sp.]|uniref:response regulator n=1 Tax=Humidesulfovibrio sp. TaxID=2910988 RepID=UPI0027EC449A|nr:response regulator [Humidesulfovibrio sp.]MDQ7835643.1 response regulator [Humidesulfovibrio sp.]